MNNENASNFVPMNQLHPEQLVSEKVAAKFLAASNRHLFNLRKAGKLKFAKPGRRVFYRVQDLIDFTQRTGGQHGLA